MRSPQAKMIALATPEISNDIVYKSMEVGIQVVFENSQQQRVCQTDSCYFTMAAINKGKSVPFKSLAQNLTQNIDVGRLDN